MAKGIRATPKQKSAGRRNLRKAQVLRVGVHNPRRKAKIPSPPKPPAVRLYI